MQISANSNELFICRAARRFVSFADKNSKNYFIPTKSKVFRSVENLTLRLLGRRLVL